MGLDGKAEEPFSLTRKDTREFRAEKHKDRRTLWGWAWLEGTAWSQGVVARAGGWQRRVRLALGGEAEQVVSCKHRDGCRGKCLSWTGQG